jgi:hypothetical protein
MPHEEHKKAGEIHPRGGRGQEPAVGSRRSGTSHARPGMHSASFHASTHHAQRAVRAPLKRKTSSSGD